MARSIEDFWKLLDEIQGEETDLTDAVKSIAKNEKTVSENLFTNIIDQLAYNSPDYIRIRSFLRDWYAAHRSLTTFQANVSDVYQMPNDQLDDLFQSFGYKYSTDIRDPISNNSSLNKINFFLDLINLYKIKGTPKALVDVLQYYGIVDVDLYEMALQFEDRIDKNPEDLVFKGRIVSGTTGDTSPIYLPFDLLTQGDPHWLQTESQIRNLVDQNVINFPSQSPYFTVKPLFDEEATDAATGILQRKVQDQYDLWEAGGFLPEDTNPILPQDAVITITGDQCSLLTIYLACIYIFNKEYEVGAPANRFVCYDGTNENSVDIIDEFRNLTTIKPLNRTDQKSRYLQYLEEFTRDIGENFLQTHEDAGYVLGILNPTVKSNLDGLATDSNVMLGTLLRDLGEWVRSNVSYGFINMSYILFGMDSLFGQLREVVEFFKPYRARIIPLEMLQLRNRLFNSIVIDDSISFDEEVTVYDYLVGDSVPCCLTADATCSALVSPREYYDCGSYHDIGAVTDVAENVQITLVDTYRDYFRCPSVDTTGYVVSEIIQGEYKLPQTVEIPNGTSEINVLYDVAQETLDYSLVINIFNEVDSAPSIIPYIVTHKSLNGFGVKFSDSFDSDNYFLTWDVIDQTNASGLEPILSGSNSITVSFSQPRSNINYSIGLTLENLVDNPPSYYVYTVVNKTVNGFTVKFSDTIDSANYVLAWTVYEYARTLQGGATVSGWEHIPNGSNTVTVAVSPSEIFDNYTLALSLVNNVDSSVSKYSFIVTSKTVDHFTIQFSSPMDSDNYYLSWAFPVASSTVFENFLFRQTGQMRDFDADGTFDCTHGMDQVDIQIEDVINFMLLESGGYVLQENGSRIIL